MPKIKLIKRTEGEREAYVEGYNAGRRIGHEVGFSEGYETGCREENMRMGRKMMQCKNCKYYESYGDPMNPRIDGQCRKLRMTQVGFVAINTQENYFCSLFKKKGDLKNES